MKYVIKVTSQFKRDLKTVKKRGYRKELLEEVVQLLADGTELPPQYKDHDLSGNWKGFRECHITPDWLLVYQYFEETLILSLTRTGSHSDLGF
jgi:mRNA interferase YafQ